jgi:hypothetical protein
MVAKIFDDRSVDHCFSAIAATQGMWNDAPRRCLSDTPRKPLSAPTWFEETSG